MNSPPHSNAWQYSPTLGGRTARASDQPATTASASPQEQESWDASTMVEQDQLVLCPNPQHRHTRQLIYIDPTTDTIDIYLAEISIRTIPSLPIEDWVQGLPQWIPASSPSRPPTAHAYSASPTPMSSPHLNVGSSATHSSTESSNDSARSTSNANQSLCSDCKVARILKDLESAMRSDIGRSPAPDDDHDHYHPDLDRIREHAQRESQIQITTTTTSQA